MVGRDQDVVHLLAPRAILLKFTVRGNRFNEYSPSNAGRGAAGGLPADVLRGGLAREPPALHGLRRLHQQVDRTASVSGVTSDDNTWAQTG